VHGTVVRKARKLGAIAGNGDALFDDIPSQTWCYRPHLNWKQGTGRWGKNTHTALGGPPGFGRYVITWRKGLDDEPSGYRVEFCTSLGRGSVNTINVYPIPKLEDAKGRSLNCIATSGER
jgi:hypothetical protein